MNTLPQRFSEKAFRRYEHVIAQIARDFPKAVHVNPSAFGLAGETVRARLRDAITSYAEHIWQSIVIDRPSFERISPSDLVVSLRPKGSVVVGTRASIRETADVFICPPATDSFDMSELTSRENLSFLCYLAHNQLLRRPVLLSIEEQQTKTLMEMYDIVLEHQSSGHYLLI